MKQIDWNWPPRRRSDDSPMPNSRPPWALEPSQFQSYARRVVLWALAFTAWGWWALLVAVALGYLGWALDKLRRQSRDVDRVDYEMRLRELAERDHRERAGDPRRVAERDPADIERWEQAGRELKWRIYGKPWRTREDDGPGRVQ